MWSAAESVDHQQPTIEHISFECESAKGGGREDADEVKRGQPLNAQDYLNGNREVNSKWTAFIGTILNLIFLL